MTLKCECGGAVELTSQSYGENSAFEAYECVACGRTGSLSFSNGIETLTGCLTSSNDY